MARMFLSRRIAIFTIVAVAILNRFRRGRDTSSFSLSWERADFLRWRLMWIVRASVYVLYVCRSRNGDRVSRAGESARCCNNARVRCNICLQQCARVREQDCTLGESLSDGVANDVVIIEFAEVDGGVPSCSINHPYRDLAWLIFPGRKL